MHSFIYHIFDLLSEKITVIKIQEQGNLLNLSFFLVQYCGWMLLWRNVNLTQDHIQEDHNKQIHRAVLWNPLRHDYAQLSPFSLVGFSFLQPLFLFFFLTFPCYPFITAVHWGILVKWSRIRFLDVAYVHILLFIFVWSIYCLFHCLKFWSGMVFLSFLKTTF